MRPVDTTLGRRRPQLQSDGRCGIYLKRPSVCRTVPAAWSTRSATVTNDAARRLARSLVCDGARGVPLLPNASDILAGTAQGKMLALPWAAVVMPTVAAGLTTETDAAAAQHAAERAQRRQLDRLLDGLFRATLMTRWRMPRRARRRGPARARRRRADKR